MVFIFLTFSAFNNWSLQTLNENITFFILAKINIFDMYILVMNEILLTPNPSKYYYYWLLPVYIIKFLHNL